MKRFILLLVLSVLIMPLSFAATPYDSFAPQKPYPISGSASTVLQKITGMNLFSRLVAQSIIKREIKKSTKESMKVKMETFSAKDLLAGKFKSISISGKNLNFDGVSISSFSSKTLYDYNYVEVKKDVVTFKENMLLDYSMDLTSDDLHKTVVSSGYVQKLNRVNLSAYGITFFKLSNADVCIKNNKIYFTLNVSTPISAKEFPIEISSDVKVSNGKIVLTRLETANSFKLIDLNKLTYFINAINPLSYTTDIMNSKSKVKINTVNIVNDTIHIDGYVFIPKNTVEKG